MLGKGYKNYGDYINDAFLTILENRDTKVNITGQTVYRDGKLSIFDGSKWGEVGTVAVPKRPSDAITTASIEDSVDLYLHDYGGTLTGNIYLEDLTDDSPGSSAVNKNYVDYIRQKSPTNLLHLSGEEESRTMIGNLILPNIKPIDQFQILSKKDVVDFLPHINYIRETDLKNVVPDGTINVVHITPSNMTFIFGIVKFSKAELFKDISLDSVGTFKSLGFQVNAVGNSEIEIDCKLFDNEVSRFLRIIRYGIPTAAIDCSVYFSAIGYML